MTARVTNILTGLLTVPITLNYLGEDLFGVWMALSSVVSFLSFYDFGIGTGLRNMLIECVGKENSVLPRRLIANSLIVLTVLAGLLILAVFAIAPLLPWSELIRCKNPASEPQILPTAQAVVSMFAIGLPITQLQNIASAYQRGYWGHLCFLLGRVLGFLFVVWCVITRQPLWFLAGGYVGCPFLITLLGWGLFLYAAPSLRPWPFSLDSQLLRGLFRVGGYVLVHHLSYAFINTSVVVLIANTINATVSVPYSLAQRLFGVASVVTSSLIMSLSVAAGEAWHRNDINWIKNATRRAEKVAILAGVLPAVALLLAGQTIIFWWTGKPDVVPSMLLMLALCIMACTAAFGDVYSNYLMAMNYVRFVAMVRLGGGVVVLTSGYYVGLLSRSPAAIAFLQAGFGVLVPTFFFWRRMSQLMNSSQYVERVVAGQS